MKVLTVLGTRPEIIKLSPLLPLLDESFDHKLAHTGQHYSITMDKIFFDGLSLRDPDFTLEVGSVDGLTQTAMIMDRLKPVLDGVKPDLVLVQGDTNSTLAGALAAVKSGIRLAHVEAGCRSFNRRMPEETNRIVADHISDILFAPDKDAVRHLRREGIADDQIFLTGSTLADACRRNLHYVEQSKILAEFSIRPQEYLVATVHRAENTNDEAALKNLVSGLNGLAKMLPVVFPVHPRTRQALTEWQITPSQGLILIEPVGYLDFLNLLSNAKFALTDSGGVQEEAAALDVPALILRDETEWMSYVRAGKNKLAGTESESIKQAGLELLENPRFLEKMKNAKANLPTGASATIIQILRS
jgi:UDP-N-acetylglucosamine 2-epimerase (non-hydrolysing)